MLSNADKGLSRVEREKTPLNYVGLISKFIARITSLFTLSHIFLYKTNVTENTSQSIIKNT